MSALTALSPMLSYGGPTGSSVVHGTATVDGTGSLITINQVTSQAIINWDSFSIGASESVNFIQPGADALALNRVTGTESSDILGSLTANGRIFLVNPNGILFGAGASIDVAGLAATTFQISDQDFIDGNYNFAGDPDAALAYVVNRGTINIGENGFLYLVAPGVESSGTIVANAAEVALASGTAFQLDFSGEGLVQFQVSGELTEAVLGPNGDPLAAAVSNSGSITAGRVLLSADAASAVMNSVVNTGGLIAAQSIDGLFGEVVFEGGSGDIDVSGTIRGTSFTSSGRNFTQAGTIGHPQYSTDIDIQNSGDVTLRGALIAGTGDVSITDATRILHAAGTSIWGSTVSLASSESRAGIGGENAPLNLNADVLNVTTNFGHIVIRDSAGGLAVGAISTGGDKGALDNTRVILSTMGGPITAAPGAGTIDAWSANLIATGGEPAGADWSIGTYVAPLQTSVNVLSASTENGSIFIDQSGQLLISDIIAKANGAVPFANADGKIVIDSNNNTSDHSIWLRADEDIFMPGRITAPGSITLESIHGSLFDALDGQTKADNLNFTARNLDLRAGGSIGLAGDRLEMNVDRLDAQALDGGIHLSESYGLQIGEVSALSSGEGAANDVVIVVNSGDIQLGDVSAMDGSVFIEADKGMIADGNGADRNILAESAYLGASRGIGTSSDRIDTDVASLSLSSGTLGDGIHISEANELAALGIRTVQGNVTIGFGPNSLNFDTNTGTLIQSGGTIANLNFENAGGSVALGGLNAGAHGIVQIKALSGISQHGGSVIADSASFEAGHSIGSGSGAVVTDVNTLTLLAKVGSIHVAEQSGDISLTASAAGDHSGVAVSAPGNLLLKTVFASGSEGITLVSSNGSILSDLDSTGNHISGTSAILSAENGAVGLADAALRSTVTGDFTMTAGSGGIAVENVGDISKLDATASGDVAFSNFGNVGLSRLEAPGHAIQLDVSGELTNAESGPAVGIISESLTLTARAVGAATSPIEIDTSRLNAVTYNGGLYLKQINPGRDLFLLYAKAAGDLSIDAAGDVLLGVVEAPGYSATIHAEGSIEDDRLTGETRANVKAKALEISGESVGSQGKLSFDVNFLSASGGAGGVSASNLGAVVVDSASLVGKGASTVSLSGASITILDEASDLIQLDHGGSLVLVAESGNIVFLDINDTIAVSGGGSISLSALHVGTGADLGKSGVIVAGNLRTDGGDISLAAESHISIGLLDAGFGLGSVTVLSNNGLILDNNGAANNIVGGTVTLSGRTPSEYLQELIREVATATAARDEGVVTSTTTLVDSLTSELDAYQASRNAADVSDRLARRELLQAAAAYAAASEDLNQKQSIYDNLVTALEAASLAKSIAEFIAGAAQAVPFTGDGGAAGVFAGVSVALDAASLAADIYQRDTYAPAQDTYFDRSLELADAQQLSANAADSLAMWTDLLNAKVGALNIAEADLYSAQIASAASTLVRGQALMADSANNVIGTANQALGVEATHLNIQTFNRSDIYLESPGQLGLGHIATAGENSKIVVNAAQNIGVLGDVISPTSIALRSQNGAIIGTHEGLLSAPEIVMLAADGIGDLNSVRMHTELVAADGGLGGVSIRNLNDEDALTVGSVQGTSGIRGSGDLSIATEGDLLLFSIIEDRSGAGDVHLTAGMGGAGAIVDANGASRNVVGGSLFAEATGSIEIDTQVDQLSAHSSDAGNVLIRELDDVTIENLSTMDGWITVIAAGDMDAKNVSSHTDSAANRISLVASEGNMTVGSIHAGSQEGRIQLSANGQVNDDNRNDTLISGHDLVITAATGIGASGANSTRALDTTVATLSAIVTGGGDVNIDEVDDLHVRRITTPDGDVTVTSPGGDLRLGSITASGSGNTITLYTNEAIVDALEDDTKSNITGENLAFLAIKAFGSSDNLIEVDVDRVEGYANDGIFLVDLSDDLIIGGVTPNLGLLEVFGLRTSGGDIRVIAERSIEQRSAIDAGSSGSGHVALTATSGSILMDHLAPTWANAGDIVYTAAGDLLLNSLLTSGNVELRATEGSIEGLAGVITHVAAKQLTASAASGMGSEATPLSTRIDTLHADVTGKGGIHLVEDDSIELANVRTADGTIVVAAGGAIDAVKVTSLTDADANDISLSAATGDIVVGQVSAGTNRGDVFMEATFGAINDDQDNATRITGDVVSLTAGSGMGVSGKSDSTRALDLEANSLTAQVTSGGDVNLSEKNDLDLKSVHTPHGNVTITSDSGDLRVHSITAGGAGSTVTLGANGSITDAQSEIDPTVNVTASQLAIGATAGIGSAANALETAVERVVAVGGTGGVYLSDLSDGLTIGGVTPGLSLLPIVGAETAGGAVHISSAGKLQVDENVSNSGGGDVRLIASEGILQQAQISAAGEGDITLESAQGDIVMSTVAQTLAAHGDVRYSTDRDVLVNRIATTGDVEIEAGHGSISGHSSALPHVAADHLSATAADGIGSAETPFTTAVNAFNGSVTSDGDIELSERDGLTLTDVETANGRVNILSGGSVHAVRVVSATDAERNDVIITAQGGGSILVDRIDAGGMYGDVVLSANTGTGNVRTSANGRVTADDLTVNAAQDISLNTTVRRAMLESTKAGSVEINEHDAIELHEVTAANGAISVTAGADIQATKVISTTDADANDITLTAHNGGSVLIHEVNAGTRYGDVLISANTPSGAVRTTADGRVTADGLEVLASGDVELTTTVNRAQVASTEKGWILLEEHDAIELTRITAANGAIGVVANGAIDARELVASTDATDNMIVVLAGQGDLRLGTVTAGKSHGDIILLARNGSIVDDADDTTRVQGNRLGMYAANGIGASGPDAQDAIDTSVNALYAQVLSAGDIMVTESDDLDVDFIGTPRGNVGIASASGDLRIRSINAGGPGNNVTLAAGGAVTALSNDGDSHVRASGLAIVAAEGIGSADERLLTALDRLEAETASGGIFLEDTAGDLLIGEVTPSLGLPKISGLRAHQGDIVLAGAGSIRIAESIAGRDVNLTAMDGSIVGESNRLHVAADQLVAQSTAGIGTQTNALQTQVDGLTARVSASGVIHVNEADSIELKDLQTADGAIRVQAKGDLSANSVVSLTDSDANGVFVGSSGGDILIGRVTAGAGERGDVTISAHGSIDELGNDQAADLIGDEMILTAGGGIGAERVLEIQANRLSLSSDNGSVRLAEQDDLVLQTLSAANGDITITAGGAINDDNVNSTRVTSRHLSLTAATGIGAVGAEQTRAIDTDVNSLSATTAKGDIRIDEVNGLSLQAATGDGDVRVRVASGDLAISSVEATGNGALVSLTTEQGSIRDAQQDRVNDILASRIVMGARDGIGERSNALEINAERLSANGGGNGVFISNASDHLAVEGLSATEGDIVINTVDSISIDSAIATKNGGHVEVTAGGAIGQNANIEVGQRGGVQLNAGTDLKMASNVTTTGESGTISYSAGKQMVLSRIRTNTDRGTGGHVMLTAPTVVRSHDNPSTIESSFFSLSSPSSSTEQIEDLLGGRYGMTGIRMNERLAGGQISYDASFSGAISIQAQQSTEGESRLRNKLDSIQVDPSDVEPSAVSTDTETDEWTITGMRK